MTFNYNFEALAEKIPSQDFDEIERQISLSIPFLEKNLDRLLDYLKKEEELNNYIEINLPFLESNISYKINLYNKKLVISVLNHDDSRILGHLLIEGYDCIGKNDLKKLGLNLKIPKFEGGRAEGLY